ncbi:MAG: lipocalin-like domain-containing protein [Proteobacteria bacterium]|nr:lipocalin-like domain-containing protein [Pseudomonadota bacterium]
MNKAPLRIRGHAARAILLVCIGLMSCRTSGPNSTDTSHVTRRDLVGTWQLLSIQLVGPNGPSVDPFFGARPTGILIYDPSGWMSVQIVGSPRPAMDTPDSFVPRATPAETAKDAQLKASVFDTYYAYFGTWRYDEATSSVIHDVKSSLLPGESGRSYSQTVSLASGNLVFSRHAMNGTIQEKVWGRLSFPGR